jgi:3-hydroxyisobutyrate dehydrogenase
MEVGFIGSGVMGSRMIGCVLDAGHTVVVYDAFPEAAAGVRARGAGWADSPRAVAERTEVVISSLPGPDEVEQVVFEPETGLLAGMHSGSCFVDTSSNSPALWRRIAAACREQGADALDCPVTGRAPEMTIMVGGNPATLEKYRPVLEAMSQGVYYMGEAGQGMVAKGINQFLLYAKFLLAGEALLIGAKAGIPVRDLTDFLASGVGAGRGLPWNTFEDVVFPAKWERVPGGNGPVDRWVKDVGCGQEAARYCNAPTPLLTVVEDVLKRAQAQGWGDLINFSAIQIMEQWAGVELRTAE